MIIAIYHGLVFSDLTNCSFCFATSRVTTLLIFVWCQNGDSSHVLRIFDEEAQAMQSVRSSAHELENANALGETILSTIHGQRERLKVSSLLPSLSNHTTQVYG